MPESPRRDAPPPFAWGPLLFLLACAVTSALYWLAFAPIALDLWRDR